MTQKLMVSFKITPNLKDQLVHNKTYQFTINSVEIQPTYRIFSWENCSFWMLTSNMKSLINLHYKKLYTVSNFATCKTTQVVYIIKCPGTCLVQHFLEHIHDLTDFTFWAFFRSKCHKDKMTCAIEKEAE